MRKIPIISFITLMVVVFPLTTKAQQRIYKDSVIENKTIHISQIYQPEIAKPEKPKFTPTLPHVDTTRPHFKYVVPQQTLSYTYHSIPIRPLALGKLEEPSYFQNYIKAGFGNLSSVYLDAGIGSLHGANYTSAIHVSHLSQNGQMDNQHAAHTALDASGKYFLPDHVLSGKLQIFRNGYSYYGYDHERYQYGSGVTSQAYTGGRVTVTAANTENIIPGLSYQPQLSFGIYGDRFNAVERSFGFKIPAAYTIDSTLTFSLGISGLLSSLKTVDTTQANNLFQVDPALTLHLNRTRIHLGLSPAIGKGGVGYLLPDLNLTSYFLKNTLKLSLGWKGSIIQNTFEQLSSTNPFIGNVYPVNQTRADQIYFGFQSTLRHHFSFGATLSWKQWKDMALFVNDFMDNPDGKRFSVVYDEKVQALNFEAFAHYQIAEVIGIGLTGSWYNYFQTTTYDKVWGMPMARIGANITARPVKKLWLTATADFWDGIYGRRSDGKADKLPAFIDLGFSGSYDIIPRLSVFMQLSNLLNNKYQRWPQYDNYGFNIIGGLRFKF